MMTTSEHPIDVLAELKSRMTVVRVILDFAADASADTLHLASNDPRNLDREYDLSVAIAELSSQTKQVQQEIDRALALHDQGALK